MTPVPAMVRSTDEDPASRRALELRFDGPIPAHLTQKRAPPCTEADLLRNDLEIAQQAWIESVQKSERVRSTSKSAILIDAAAREVESRRRIIESIKARIADLEQPQALAAE